LESQSVLVSCNTMLHSRVQVSAPRSRSSNRTRATRWQARSSGRALTTTAKPADGSSRQNTSDCDITTRHIVTSEHVMLRALQMKLPLLISIPLLVVACRCTHFVATLLATLAVTRRV
jgi:hypothetical protein